MRKVLSFVLVLSLVLGSFGFAFAAAPADTAVPSDVAGTSNETAVSVLMALEIINGYEDGTYRPDNIVTRAEMAKILIAASGYGDIVNEAKSSFSDMAGHWADKYVAYAASLGLVNGYPDGTFKPNATVSYAEAATMMIRALGYTDASLAGTWPANYVTKAMVLGLYDKVSTKVGGANRGDIAQMTFALLDEHYGKVDKDNIFQETGKDAASYDTMLKRLGATVSEDPEVVKPFMNNSSESYIDLTQYIGQKVDLYREKTGDKKIICVSKVYSDIITGELDVAGKILKGTNGKEYKLKSTTVATDMVFTNGVEKTGVTTLGSYDKKLVTIAGTLSGITMDPLSANGFIPDSVTQVISGDLYDIEDVVAEDSDALFGYTVPTKDDDSIDYKKMKIEGDVKKLEDIEKDDVVLVYTDNDKEIVKLIVSKQTVEGDVTKIETSPDKVFIDGKAYKVAPDPKKALTESDLGSTVKASVYTNPLGTYIYTFKEVDAASAGNYAVVLDANPGLSAQALPASVKLLTKAGEVIRFNINKSADYKNSAGNTVDLVGDNGTNIVLTGTALTEVTKGAIVTYSTNSAGDINKITYQDDSATPAMYVARTNTFDNKTIASNVVVFKYDSAKDSNNKVVSLDSLKDEVAFPAWYVVKDSKVVAISVASSNVKSQILTGVVMSFGKVKDGSDTVQEVNMLINGELKAYKTNNESGISGIAKGSVYSFSLAGDKINASKVTRAATSAEILGAVRTISAVDLDLNTIDIRNIANDATDSFEYGATKAIYEAVFKADGDFKEWKAVEERNIRPGAKAAVYNLTNKDSDDLNTDRPIYETVFIVQKADLDNI